MTKDVLVTVSGRQFDVAEEPVEVTAQGTYYLKNGKHYVLYEEQPEDAGELIKNRIKLQEECIEIKKSGAVSSVLKLVAGERTASLYRTGAGAVTMEVDTKDIAVTEVEGLLQAKVCYELHINGQFVSNCEVDVKVQAV